VCAAAVCAMIKCGQGTCKPSNASIIGFDCECDPGWKEIQIGPLTFPSCVIPNCEFLSLSLSLSLSTCKYDFCSMLTKSNFK
jgi:hypothetical protein